VFGLDYAREPSGLWGLLKESFAGSAELAHASTDPNANPLVKAVAADFTTSEGWTVARDGLKAEFANSQPAEIKTKAIDSLRQVAAVLNAKAPGDAAAFKGCVRSVKRPPRPPEGGSLFGGGVQVSEAEKATLGEISSALGI
jgi:hypothetical protein